MRNATIRGRALAYVFLLTSACGGGSPPDDDAGADATTEAGLMPITVQGTVVDREGYAYPGVTVLIPGGLPVLTNGSGQFTVANITPPYDVYLARDDADGGTLYTGLTRTNPWLDAMFAPANEEGSTLTGTLMANGSSFVEPNPADRTVSFQVTTNRSSFQRGYGGSEDPSPFQINFTWGGATALAGTVHAFQYVTSGTTVTSYTSYGSTSFTGLDPSESLGVGTIQMGPVTTHALGGTITVEGGGYNVALVQSGVTLLDGSPIQHASSEGAITTFTHQVPGVIGATGRVTVVALPSVPSGLAGIVVTRAGIALPASELAITIPNRALPLAVSPPAAASGVGPGSVLSWNEVPNATYIVLVDPEGSTPGQPRLRVVTTAESLTIPDFSPYGVTLPTAASYTWRIIAFTERASSDELAVPDRVRLGTRFEGTDIIAAGASRTFTTP